MSNVYDQVHTAFKNISAYAVLDTRTGKIVATVNAKDTAVRTQAFVHWLGIKPFRGAASGGGYDRLAAAVHDAATLAIAKTEPAELVDPSYDVFRCATFFRILNDSRNSWIKKLEEAEFEVVSII